MADNVTITPGAGNTVAADEVVDGTLGTVKVQYVKIMDGTIDGTTKATVGGNGLKTDGSGVTQPVSGTVTANAGTNLNTSALALDASVTGLSVAQASTTSGEKGILVQGASTDSYVLHTNAKTNPLSLTSLGQLRVAVGHELGLASLGSAQSVIFPDNNSNVSGPLWICNGNSGGAFSGTTDAARLGVWVARVPTVFRTVSATASGNTAVWTAATGNKWRLLRYKIEVTANASVASGGVITVKFQDVTTDINLTHSVFVPTTGLTTNIDTYWTSEWTDIGPFGILAAATATALNINLGSTLATGVCRVIVCGVEE